MEAPSPSEPPRNLQNSPFRRSMWNQCEKRRSIHPSGVVGFNFEAAIGPVQFKLRTPEAIPHARHFKLRMLVIR
eukprot:4376733-Alexandrium_andersonii.AAC.1